MPIRPPAKNPCGSCPYRRDVPSGVWSPSEYDKLGAYDLDTGEQPVEVFMCHQQDERPCAGWVGVHDMEHCLALRIASSMGHVEDTDAFLDYETTTPLFSSGAEAAAHGMRRIEDPDDDARRVAQKLVGRRERGR